MTNCYSINERNFPSQPTPKSLRETYSLLRSTAQSINRSRGQYISQLQKKDLAIEALRNEIFEYAKQANLDYQEKAHLLGIMTKYSEIFESMEKAGDDLVNGAETYRNGIGSYSGGRPFADLIQAVYRFMTTWRKAKEMSQQIKIEVNQ